MQGKLGSLSIGCYEIEAINNVIQRFIEKEASRKADMINLSPNPNSQVYFRNKN